MTKDTTCYSPTRDVIASVRNKSMDSFLPTPDPHTTLEKQEDDPTAIGFVSGSVLDTGQQSESDISTEEIQEWERFKNLLHSHVLLPKSERPTHQLYKSLCGVRRKLDPITEETKETKQPDWTEFLGSITASDDQK